MTKHFPNGFTSWMETHHEIVSLIAEKLLAEPFDETDVVGRRQIDKGSGGMYELAEELTDKFEKQTEGREWDGEWRDEIDSFFTAENLY